MKKIIPLLSLTLLLQICHAFGQTTSQPAGNPPVNVSAGRPLTASDWIFVASPLILSFVVLFILSRVLKGYDLKDALTENEPVKEIRQNPVYSAVTLASLLSTPALASSLPPTIEVTKDEKSKSSSRYLALITSSMTLMIGIVLVSFFIYTLILTGKPPEIGKLSDMLLAMGIGVVPYAFNKVSDAIKK